MRKFLNQMIHKEVKFFVGVFLLIIYTTSPFFAQDAKVKDATEENQYGNTLNLGLGFGYRGGFPLLLNYEFDAAKNITIAPFISFLTYQSSYYWGNPHYPYQYYSYRVTYIPLGAKGTYYFDELLKAKEKWDFYAALSIGAAYGKTVWESGYGGTYDVKQGSNGLFWGISLGCEYHFNQKTGIFFDLSTVTSSIGISVKLK